MNNEMDLMQRLAVSKKIMERHGEIKRGDARPTSPMVENFDSVPANYNLPEGLLQEESQPKQYSDPTQPLDQSRIMNSKLPDEIKALMIEQPIIQSSSLGSSTAISEEVIQGAQRLMNMGKNNNPNSQTKNVSENINVGDSKTNHNTSNININEIKSMIRDVVRDTVRDVVREELKQSGMVVESTTNTNETIQFKVGNTLFIGKVTKVKKFEK